MTGGERDQQRAKIAVDGLGAINAVGVGKTDAGDGQRLLFDRRARGGHRDDRRFIQRDDVDVEGAGWLVTAAAVGECEVKPVGKMVVGQRTLKPVMFVAQFVRSHIRDRKRATHAEDFAVQQQLSVLDVAGHAKLNLGIQIIRIGAE